jgi:hypothetical protein
VKLYSVGGKSITGLREVNSVKTSLYFNYFLIRSGKIKGTKNEKQKQRIQFTFGIRLRPLIVLQKYHYITFFLQ